MRSSHDVASCLAGSHLGQHPIEGRQIEGAGVDQGQWVVAQANGSTLITVRDNPGVSLEAEIDQSGTTGFQRESRAGSLSKWCSKTHGWMPRRK